MPPSADACQIARVFIMCDPFRIESKFCSQDPDVISSRLQSHSERCIVQLVVLLIKQTTEASHCTR